MSYPDYRALCAELLQPLAEYDGANPYHEHRALITRARAALAQPEPVAPTDEDLEAWRQAAIAQFEASGYDISASRTVALLAIEWCRKCDLSAIAPVPVSEQPGQPEPVAPTDEELLRTYGGAKRDHCYDGPIDDWPRRAERAATVHGLRAVLARWGSPAAGGTTDLPPVQETAPERIWLHLNGANEWLPFKDEDGVVWSPDQIDESDIPYVRADLAQPGPVAPTDEELDELWAEIDGGGAIWAWQPYARAVLARWGSPNPATATAATP